MNFRFNCARANPVDGAHREFVIESDDPEIEVQYFFPIGGPDGNRSGSRLIAHVGDESYEFLLESPLGPEREHRSQDGVRNWWIDDIIPVMNRIGLFKPYPFGSNEEQEEIIELLEQALKSWDGDFSREDGRGRLRFTDKAKKKVESGELVTPR